MGAAEAAGFHDNMLKLIPAIRSARTGYLGRCNVAPATAVPSVARGGSYDPDHEKGRLVDSLATMLKKKSAGSIVDRVWFLGEPFVEAPAPR
jgi:hypothetical protein